MTAPLANPVRTLVDDAGRQPARLWQAGGAAAGLLGAVIGRILLERLRTRSRRDQAPLNPADERISWPHALVWAGIIGISSALGRMLAQVVVAAAWKRKEQRPVAAMPS